MRLFITALLFMLTSCGSISTVTAQTPNSNTDEVFVGTWEWANGNQTFRVQLSIDEDDGDIQGHYTMVQTNNQGLEIIVYKSNKDVGFGLTLGPVLYASGNSERISGTIIDVVTPNPNDHPALDGKLTMEIITTGNCIGCTTTATWKVKENKDMRFENDNRSMTIPIDITLTKVN